jgi:hypothetical protein
MSKKSKKRQSVQSIPSDRHKCSECGGPCVATRTSTALVEHCTCRHESDD